MKQLSNISPTNPVRGWRLPPQSTITESTGYLGVDGNNFLLQNIIHIKALCIVLLRSGWLASNAHSLQKVEVQPCHSLKDHTTYNQSQDCVIV